MGLICIGLGKGNQCCWLEQTFPEDCLWICIGNQNEHHLWSSNSTRMSSADIIRLVYNFNTRNFITLFILPKIKGCSAIVQDTLCDTSWQVWGHPQKWPTYTANMEVLYLQSLTLSTHGGPLFHPVRPWGHLFWKTICDLPLAEGPSGSVAQALHKEPAPSCWKVAITNFFLTGTACLSAQCPYSLWFLVTREPASNLLFLLLPEFFPPSMMASKKCSLCHYLTPVSAHIL